MDDLGSNFGHQRPPRYHSPPLSAHFRLFGGEKKVPPLQTQRHNSITRLTITSKWSIAMMKILLSLEKYPALCELKLLGAS